MRYVLAVALLLAAPALAAPNCPQRATDLDAAFREIYALRHDGKKQEAEAREEKIAPDERRFASLCAEIGSCPRILDALASRRFQEYTPDFHAHSELYQQREAICPELKQGYVMPSGDFTYSVAECETKAKKWDEWTQGWFTHSLHISKLVDDFMEDQRAFYFDCIKPYRCPILMTGVYPSSLEYYRDKPQFFQKTFQQIKVACGRG